MPKHTVEHLYHHWLGRQQQERAPLGFKGNSDLPAGEKQPEPVANPEDPPTQQTDSQDTTSVRADKAKATTPEQRQQAPSKPLPKEVENEDKEMVPAHSSSAAKKQKHSALDGNDDEPARKKPKVDLNKSQTHEEMITNPKVKPIAKPSKPNSSNQLSSSMGLSVDQKCHIIEAVCEVAFRDVVKVCKAKVSFSSYLLVSFSEIVSMLLIGPFGHLSLVLSEHLGPPGRPPLFIFHSPSLKILGMMHLLTYSKRGLNRKPISLKKISVWSLLKLYCSVLVWYSMMLSSLQRTRWMIPCLQTVHNWHLFRDSESLNMLL